MLYKVVRVPVRFTWGQISPSYPATPFVSFYSPSASSLAFGFLISVHFAVSASFMIWIPLLSICMVLNFFNGLTICPRINWSLLKRFGLEIFSCFVFASVSCPRLEFIIATIFKTSLVSSRNFGLLKVTKSCDFGWCVGCRSDNSRCCDVLRARC